MTALAIAGVALPVRAQDIGEMVKWTSAQAIHYDVVGAKTGPLGSNSLELTLKRSYPAARVAYAGEGPCNNWLDWPAKTENLMGGCIVPLGMMFAMPQAAGFNLTVGEDGKTMTLVDEPNGWKYTYTLRIVK